MCRLQRAADSILQLLSIASTERQSCPAGQEHDIFAVEPRLQFAHTLDVDDVRAMNPEKDRRIELGLDRIHRLAEDVGFRSDVEFHVVPGSLDPLDVSGAQEKDTAAGFDHEPFE